MADEIPTRSDWDRCFAPASVEDSDAVRVLDLEAVTERITRRPALQRWLREAGFEAARGLGAADAAAQARAHGACSAP